MAQRNPLWCVCCIAPAQARKRAMKGSENHGDGKRRKPGKAGRHDRARGGIDRRPCARRQGRHRRGDLRPGHRGRARAGHRAVRRPCAAGRRARPRQDQAGRDHGHRARPRRPPRPVHARSDAVRHSRHRGAGGKPGRQAQLPLHRRPGVRAIADGRRDQPRLAAHAVGAAAGDAGAARDRRRRAPRSAQAVPRAGDAEPARAGRHLSAARSAARPLPDGSRRRLSRPRRRAQNPVRHHRRRRDPRQGGDDAPTI